MRELSEEELLDVLNILKGGIKWRDKEFNLQAYKQIKESILNQPEVNEDFIQNHAEIIFQNTPEQQLNVTIWAERIRRILKDAGVKNV